MKIAEVHDKICSPDVTRERGYKEVIDLNSFNHDVILKRIVIVPETFMIRRDFGGITRDVLERKLRR